MAWHNISSNLVPLQPYASIRQDRRSELRRHRQRTRDMVTHRVHMSFTQERNSKLSSVHHSPSMLLSKELFYQSMFYLNNVQQYVSIRQDRNSELRRHGHVSATCVI